MAWRCAAVVPPTWPFSAGRSREKCASCMCPTGCDGIYFQAFTECPKCQCPRCANRTMGELMLEFVNPIVDDLKREFPDLWISCGIHADFGDFAYLADLDPRCNIYWENCDAGTSLRGDDEDFGYIYKSLPYGHGYSQTCPSDPPYTEESLQAWMAGNAERYRITGGRQTHIQYLAYMQDWARRFLGKPSKNTHASVVADHAVLLPAHPVSVCRPGGGAMESVQRSGRHCRWSAGIPGHDGHRALHPGTRNARCATWAASRRGSARRIRRSSMRRTLNNGACPAGITGGECEY